MLVNTFTDPLNNGLIFLINILFDLYLMVLGLRVILHSAGANYFNPFTQVIVKLTQPIVKPVRKLIPNVGHIEMAAIVCIIILEIVRYFIVDSLRFLIIPNFLGILILAFADILKLFLNIFFYAILLQAILSWIQGPYSPGYHFLSQITAPIMRPFSRMIPPISGIDLTPIPVIIIIYLLSMVIVPPLFVMGSQIAVSGLT